MKRKPIKRSAIKRKPRPSSETLRVYGVPKRRVWIRERPCVVCGATPCVNAHIKVDGMGRKSDYTNIVPMCFDCDALIGTPRPRGREWWAEQAAQTEAAWLTYSGTTHSEGER